MKYPCPCCKQEIEWSASNEFRPFCSAQCKNQDFVGWANESHVIEGSNLYDDLLSGDVEIARMSGYKDKKH